MMGKSTDHYCPQFKASNMRPLFDAHLMLEPMLLRCSKATGLKGMY